MTFYHILNSFDNTNNGDINEKVKNCFYMFFYNNDFTDGEDFLF